MNIFFCSHLGVEPRPWPWMDWNSGCCQVWH